jgi:ATP-dependent DNA helicase RecQ
MLYKKVTNKNQTTIMSLTTARATLKQYFGYDTLYPTQEKAIAAVLSGKNALVLMPTGGGKSMCYQIPALVKSGTAIVVSPLIALMKDQVDGLKAAGIAAEFLNSSLDAQEQADIIERTKNGEIKLLYVSAERLVTPSFFRLLQEITVSLFAIDEAHCISAWGHDFRPEYTQLSNLTSSFPTVPIIALTATADSTTRQDILTQLELADPLVLVDSFDRPNISLTVLPGVDRITKITEFLQNKQNQPGIIYCLSRKTTEELAKKLQQLGLSAASYHAGMNSAERSRVQRSFIRDRTQIICATIAFGMGIDKLNVRWVIHYNLPKNIEGYYQEIGRSGRDGAPAEALLFYTYRDYQTLKQFCMDSSQKELQLAKLERMKEFAESVICRRQGLLHYFGEPYYKKCHNCDVCETKIPTFDGTQIVQFVLQTIAQTKQPLTTQDLASALSNSDLQVNFAAAHFYLSQLKNAGILAQLFDKKQQLTLTRFARKILAENKKVPLVTLDTFIKKQETAAQKIKPKRAKLRSSDYQNPIFEALRQKRLEVSQAQKLPAYMIFSDKTLLQMAQEKPTTKAQMLAISGVGELKWERYGEEFLEAIAKL